MESLTAFKTESCIGIYFVYKIIKCLRFFMDLRLSFLAYKLSFQSPLRCLAESEHQRSIIDDIDIGKCYGGKFRRSVTINI